MIIVEEFRMKDKEGLYFNRTISKDDIIFLNNHLKDCIFSVDENKINFHEDQSYDKTGFLQLKKLSYLVELISKCCIELRVNGKINLINLVRETEDYIFYVEDSICYYQERLWNFSNPVKL